MTPTPNRCILLTPPGVAGIAVVRLSGEGVEPFVARHFSAKARPGGCVHGQWADIDDPVVVLHENRLAADVNLHGGAWIVHRFMELAESEGFARVTGPVGEGKTALAREVWASLPGARTELAIRTLLAQESAWQALLARAEPPNRFDLQSILEDRALHWLLALPTVTIMGPANVGKSTLANQLYGQSRSIVADVPGTTRDWVGEIADVDGLAVMLVDTPGLRISTDPIESAAIAASRGRWGPTGSADLRLLVLDPTQPTAGEQRALADEFPDAVRILNKSDRPAAWDVSAIAGGAIPTVATTGEGLGAMRSAILRHFGCERVEPNRPRIWTERQRMAVRSAIEEGTSLRAVSEG